MKNQPGYTVSRYECYGLMEEQLGLAHQLAQTIDDEFMVYLSSLIMEEVKQRREKTKPRTLTLVR